MSEERKNKNQQINKLDEIIKELQNGAKVFDDNIPNLDEVKDGTLTEDEAKKEPSILLFRTTLSTAVETLNSDLMRNKFKEMIDNGFTEEMAADLLSSIAIDVACSVFKSIIYYDDLLKDQLTKQFDNIADYFNIMRSEVSGTQKAMVTFTDKLNQLEKEIKELKKDGDH